MIARELEAKLRQDLRDEATWTVYADWLSSQGDSRGELIGYEQRAERETDRALAEQWRSRARQLFEREHPRWLGPLRRSIQPTWRRGFVTEAVVHHRPRWAAETLLGSRTGALSYRMAFTHLLDCRPVADALAGSWVDVVELRSLETTKIEALADIEGLHELFIHRSRITDLAALAGLPALERLLIHHGELEQSAFERGFEALRHLGLSGFGWVPRGEEARLDLGGLARLPALELLELRASRGIVDLGPLALLPRLRQLDISNTQVRSLAPLEQIATLERVDAIDSGGFGSEEVERLRARGVHVEQQPAHQRFRPR